MDDKTELFKFACEGKKAIDFRWFDYLKLVLLLLNGAMLYAVKEIPDKVPGKLFFLLIVLDAAAVFTSILIAISWRWTLKKEGKGVNG